jgi:hypothetical protein
MKARESKRSRFALSARRDPRALFLDSRARPRRPKATPSATVNAADALAALAATDTFLPDEEYRTSTGRKVIHAQQYYGCLKVYRSSRVFKLERGRVTATPALYRLPKKLNSRPEIRPAPAVLAAIAFLQQRGIVNSRLKAKVVRDVELAHLPNVPAVIDLRRGLFGPARMHLEIFPRTRRRFELAWVIDLTLSDRRAFQVVVSARGPRAEPLFLAPVDMAAFSASWSPTPGPPVTGTFPIPPVATSDGLPGVASDWLPGGTLARGPNVACVNAAGTQFEALGSPSVDNVFVWCNVLHDMFVSFGFDATHHAFEGNDPLVAFRHAAPKLEGGFFDNWVDGVKPRLRLYSSPFGGLHAGQDPSIVIHEYAHGVTSRLVGGSRCQYPFATLQSLGFAEGQSDYFALTILNFVGRRLGAVAPVTLIGQLFKPGGMRSYASNPSVWSNQLRTPHEIGQVWCAGLLAARGVIAARTSPDAADRFIWQACIDFLKLIAPQCRETLDITLTHAKNTLVEAMNRLEQRHPQFVGAGASTRAALTMRNV